LLPPSAIKTTADEYIAKHSLSDPRNSRMVLLDEELGRAVGVKKPAPGESLARDEVIKRLRAGVSWHVSVGGVIRWANDLPPRHPPAFTPSYTVF
jgi:translation initiation factor 2D